MNGHIDYQLLKSVSNRIGGDFPITFTAQGISFYSNTIQKGDVYVPFEEGDYDGHQLVETAIENGAAATFWEEGKKLPSTLPGSFPVFYVDNVMGAIQRLGKEYMLEVDPSKIMVAGNYSRKVTKKILGKVLDQSYCVHESNDGGTLISALETIMSMSRETGVVILDNDISSQESTAELIKQLQPSIAVISENAEHDATYARVVETGMKASGTVVVNGDNSSLLSGWKTDVITVGRGKENVFQIRDVEIREERLTFQIEGIFIDFQVPSYLSNHLDSILYAIATGLHLGVGAEQLASSLEKLTMEDLGLDVIGNASGSVVVFDHQKVEDSNMEYSLSMLKYLHAFDNRAVIVDEGFQSNPFDKTLHETFASEITAPVTHVITIGEKAFWVTEALNRKADDTHIIRHFDNHAQTINLLTELIESSSILLYRGANRELLEQIIQELNRG